MDNPIKGDIYLADVSLYHNDKNSSRKIRPVIILSDKKKQRNSILVCMCTSSFKDKCNDFVTNGFFINDKPFDKKTFVDIYNTHCIHTSKLRGKIGTLNSSNKKMLNKRIASLFSIEEV